MRVKEKPLSNLALIAPCGMNCGICRANLRKTKKCPGCRGRDVNKSKSCVQCTIRNCEIFRKSKGRYCFECGKFPCDKLKHLDHRYKTRYQMSIIENLGNIRNSGIREFAANEKIRWSCNFGGGIICVHNKKCTLCGKSNGMNKLNK